MVSVEASEEEWREVRHAVRARIDRHKRLAAKERIPYKIVSNEEKAKRLEGFLARMSDVKYRG